MNSKIFILVVALFISQNLAQYCVCECGGGIDDLSYIEDFEMKKKDCNIDFCRSQKDCRGSYSSSSYSSHFTPLKGTLKVVPYENGYSKKNNCNQTECCCIVGKVSIELNNSTINIKAKKVVGDGCGGKTSIDETIATSRSGHTFAQFPMLGKNYLLQSMDGKQVSFVPQKDLKWASCQFIAKSGGGSGGVIVVVILVLIVVVAAVVAFVNRKKFMNYQQM
eukprot:TRINITY_DN12146_c0_g1_i1.p1 TRINITY_DN12146_c0_g1~~TRINITY_DN12146_c0_g1_i1.p1  ORF type:complete len:221 (-),score=46.95 TRINITY_DN12146_c0_g1_i1:35-697(-)